MIQRTGYNFGTVFFYALGFAGSTTWLYFAFKLAAGSPDFGLVLGISLFVFFFSGQLLFHLLLRGTVYEFDEEGVKFYHPFVPKLLWTEIESVRLQSAVQTHSGPGKYQMTVYPQNGSPIEVVLKDPEAFYRRANGFVAHLMYGAARRGSGTLEFTTIGMRHSAQEILGTLECYLEKSRAAEPMKA